MTATWTRSIPRHLGRSRVSESQRSSSTSQTSRRGEKQFSREKATKVSHSFSSRLMLFVLSLRISRQSCGSIECCCLCAIKYLTYEYVCITLIIPRLSDGDRVINDWRNCDDGSFKYKPRLGDAVLFWGVYPDGEIDPHSLHGGCPVRPMARVWNVNRNRASVLLCRSRKGSSGQ